MQRAGDTGKHGGLHVFNGTRSRRSAVGRLDGEIPLGLRPGDEPESPARMATNVEIEHRGGEGDEEAYRQDGDLRARCASAARSIIFVMARLDSKRPHTASSRWSSSPRGHTGHDDSFRNLQVFGSTDQAGGPREVHFERSTCGRETSSPTGRTGFIISPALGWARPGSKHWHWPRDGRRERARAPCAPSASEAARTFGRPVRLRLAQCTGLGDRRVAPSDIRD